MWALLGKGHNKETPPDVPLFKPQVILSSISQPQDRLRRGTHQKGELVEWRVQAPPSTLLFLRVRVVKVTGSCSVKTERKSFASGEKARHSLPFLAAALVHWLPQSQEHG